MCYTASANSHCRAPLRLPLPPAPRIFNTPVSVAHTQAAVVIAGALKRTKTLLYLGMRNSPLGKSGGRAFLGAMRVLGMGCVYATPPAAVLGCTRHHTRTIPGIPGGLRGWAVPGTIPGYTRWILKEVVFFKPRVWFYTEMPSRIQPKPR